MSIRQKLGLGIILPLLVLAALMMGAFHLANRMMDGMNAMYQGEVVQLKELKQIADLYAVNIIDAANKTNVGGMTGVEARQGMLDARSQTQTIWRTYRSASMSDEENRLADEVEQLLTPADREVDRIVAVLDGIKPGELAPYIMPLYNTVDPFSTAVSNLVEYQLLSAERSMAALNGLKSARLGLLMVLGGAAMVALVLVGLWIGRSVSQPLALMASGLSRMERDLDLSQQIPIVRQDELGSLARGLNGVSQQFRLTIGEISGMTRTLADSARALSTLSGESRNLMNRQQAETEQSATAMNQMSATVSEVAHSSTSAADAAARADQSARRGQSVVREAIKGSETLSSQIRSTADLITQLTNASNDISSVMDVIRGIAEQTNLLALNAAIEAARAGDQGRGFAVVADEVRTLAQRTQNSTSEIAQTIDKLQQGASQAAESMQQGLAMVDQTTETVRQCGSALEEIVGAVDLISEMNTHIATAAEEQSKVAEEISRNVSNISHIASETNASADTLMGRSSELEDLAAGLKAKVGQFHC
ncbi:methyl-accepting chemotaxis protein [Aeromonas schubertii]|uniref:Methyl-accepting chemotaxis protein n=1 Tax=Aeromonas schubertii TaxID=652 RepID=A0ABS7VGH1_9GAMM|nr:methyl-accepting chemotaxis protein [Aeromonas schubertii]MBZ6068061.1 methyl-accepting chemotaxis protein [Aeromonas schubertii]